MAYKGNFNGNADIGSFTCIGDVNVVQLVNSTLSNVNVWAKTLALTVSKGTGVESYRVAVTTPSLYQVSAYCLATCATASTTLYPNYGDGLTITATPSSGYTISGGTGTFTMTSNMTKNITAAATVSATIVEGFKSASGFAAYIYFTQTETTGYGFYNSSKTQLSMPYSSIVGQGGLSVTTHSVMVYAKPSSSSTYYALQTVHCTASFIGTSYNTDDNSVDYASVVKCTITNSYSRATLNVTLTVAGNTAQTVTIQPLTSSTISGIGLLPTESVSYTLNITLADNTSITGSSSGTFNAYDI